MSVEQHRACGKGIIARCAVVTLSDTRDESTDKSGAAIKSFLTAAGHTVAHYQIIKDEPANLRQLLNELLAKKDIDAIITNGGTGVAARDQTIPVVESIIQLPLPGFGELFRMLSYEQVGAAAMLSRAAAGAVNGKLVFALPGSTRAVELAMQKLIGPELGHLLNHLRK
jgi:molybdenum cofactor biosynthesis protein B